MIANVLYQTDAPVPLVKRVNRVARGHRDDQVRVVKTVKSEKRGHVAKKGKRERKGRTVHQDQMDQKESLVIMDVLVFMDQEEEKGRVGILALRYSKLFLGSPHKIM